MIAYFFHFGSYRSPCGEVKSPTEEPVNEPASSSRAFPIDPIDDAADEPQDAADEPQDDADEPQDGLSSCPGMRETLAVLKELQVI